MNDTMENRLKAAEMGEPMRTIVAEFDERKNNVLVSATFQNKDGTERLITACDKRTDPFVFGTLPRKDGEEDILDTPLEKRQDELEGYAARTVRFERGMESASDLYRLVDPPEWTRIRVKNKGERALRFLTPDGRLLRVPAGYTETIWAKEALDEVTAETCPAARVKITVDARTEMNVSVVELVGGSWCEIGAVMDNTAELNDYLLRIRGVGGSLLGVLQTTAAFSGRPALSFVDCKRYGAEFSVRNVGDRPVLLRFPEDGKLLCTLSPDGTERALSELLASSHGSEQHYPRCIDTGCAVVTELHETDNRDDR